MPALYTAYRPAEVNVTTPLSTLYPPTETASSTLLARGIRDAEEALRIGAMAGRIHYRITSTGIVVLANTAEVWLPSTTFCTPRRP